MINVSLPADIEQFVHQAVAEGRYANEQEVVTDAIRFLRDSKVRHQRLREGIDEALAEVDRGLGIEIDSEDSLAAFFDELEAEVHATIAGEKSVE
ncbi:MAG: type II toxin-antitoxin system ParD family antitoxin [Thermoguttaceae bacterium]|jgi:putative addiction module CopG family antidote